MLGTAGLPHILIRFYTVPTARVARKSVLWAIGIIGVFYLMTLALGFGAAALVGGANITAQDKAGNTAAPQLAQALGERYLGGSTGGAILLAVIAAVAFATILAVVAGPHTGVLVVARARLLRQRSQARSGIRAPGGRGGSRAPRWSSAPSPSCCPSSPRSLNVAFLVALAFAVAASGNLPAMLYSLFWKKFTTTGATAAIYGGLISAVVLVFFSPVVSGSETAMFPKHDWQWFPLSNPGIISIPIGFLCGWLGTVLSRTPADADKYAELEVRSLTGAGAH